MLTYIWTVGTSYGNLLFFIIIGTTIFAIPKIIDIKDLSLGSVVLSFLYLSGPLANVINFVPNLKKMLVAITNIKKVENELCLKNKRIDKNIQDKDYIKWQKIEYKNISYKYPEVNNEQFCLKTQNFVINKGEIVFITGGNGSGKTTLAKVLSFLYTSASGEIKIDGETIKQNEEDNIRERLFSILFCDFCLFDGLLMPDTDLTFANQILQKLWLDKKVSIKEGKISTVNLSQGQKKRLALFKILLENKDIFLLDEICADQDPCFRKYFYEILLLELKQAGKTIIAISHDDRYFGVADRIIHLESGENLG